MRGALPRAGGRLFWSLWAFWLFISICSPLARCDTTADLEVTKRVDNPAPYEGDTFVYTVTITNKGPDAATGVEVTDLLPAGISYAWHRASQGSYEPGTGVWKVGALAPSSSATLEITASVNQGTAGSVIVNIAEVTKVDQADPDSTPANGRLGEDDLGRVVIVPRLAIKLDGYLSAFLMAYPESTEAQTTKFDFNLGLYANLSITLSGLTISSLGRLDLAGLEYEAVTLRAALGWLQVSDQFIFVRAPGSNELAFERKSFTLEGQLKGLRVRNLAVWIAGPPPRFEETLTVWGSIPAGAGAGVASEAKLCLGEACAHPLVYERITISGLSLAGIALMSVTTFRPTEPIDERLTLQFKLADLAIVNATLVPWPALLVSSLWIRATEGPWSIVLNYDPQLNLSRATVTLLLALARGISVRSITTITPGEELDQLITAIVRADPWELIATAIFGQGQLQSVEFTLQLASAALDFALSARFTPMGLEYVLSSLRIGF